MFKVGDIIRCIDESDKTYFDMHNKLAYQVIDIDPSYGLVYIINDSNEKIGHHSANFESATPFINETKLKKVLGV